MARKSKSSNEKTTTTNEEGTKRTRVLPEYAMVRVDKNGREEEVCRVKGLSEARGAYIMFKQIGDTEDTMLARQVVERGMNGDELLKRCDEE